MDIKNWHMLKLLDPELISKITIAYVLGSEAIIVTKEDEVFSFGSNASGCLGLGEAEASLSPRKIEALCNKRVKDFASGSGPFVVALTEDGEVYSWGKNDAGQVGNNSPGGNVLTPNLVGGELLEKKVIAIACGGFHTLALTAEGQVFYWGVYGNQKTSQSGIFQEVNLFGAPQPNRGVQSLSVPYLKTPKKINFNTEVKVTGIACRNMMSVALMENGELYEWGYDGEQLLAFREDNNFCQPNPYWISSLRNAVITKVACGYAHTLALSDIGELFAWGENTYGQLGTGSIRSAVKPVRITNIGRVVDIAAVHNINISAAMTETSEVYMWGFCRGQNITKPIKTHFKSLNDVFACCASVTPTPIRVENAGTTVAESMRKAFNDQISSDLTVVVEGQPLYVHKAFLKIRCEHLRTSLHERWQEDNTDVYEINDISYRVYRAFLEYLYTDEVKLPLEDALGLLDVANSYCEEQLKEKCMEIIKHGLTVENVVFVFESILKYDIKELEESCLKFSIYHMSAVIKTDAFKNLPPKTQMEFIEKAAELGAFKA